MAPDLKHLDEDQSYGGSSEIGLQDVQFAKQKQAMGRHKDQGQGDRLVYLYRTKARLVLHKP